MQDLKALFLSFAGYGKGQQSVGEMDGARLIKLCKDCKFVGKDLSTTDIDLIFAKVRNFWSEYASCKTCGGATACDA